MNVPYLCIICGETIKGDMVYINHMETVHGTSSPDKALATQKSIASNVPKIVLDKNAPPPPEFAEIAAMMDNPLPSTPVPPPIVPPVVTAQATVPSGRTGQQEGKNKIVLKYRYEGNCPTCNAPVRTIILNANGKTIATAYCLTHEEIEQREVHPIEEATDDLRDQSNHLDLLLEHQVRREELAKYLFSKKKKGGKKNVKSNSHVVSEKDAIQSSMPTTRLSQTS